MATLQGIRLEKRKRWLKDWSEGLAFCYHCDNEYTDSQTIVVKEEKSCPHCKEPERKTYYYCKEHGSSHDDCER
jgi:hypothetical protein